VAVKIRLMRVGKKKQPSYRVVVADSRSPRDGRFIEIIGRYAPRQEPSAVEIDTDKAVSWLRKGAQPTEQVAKLLDVTGVWDAFKSATGSEAAAKPKPKTPKPKTPKPVEAAAEAAPAAAETAAETAADAGAGDGPEAGGDAEASVEPATEASDPTPDADAEASE
jgi:small subunit ribosomal protein S16